MTVLAATAVVCQASEYIPTDLPELVQDGVNSGAHPVLGYSAVLIARRLNVSKLSRLKQAVIYSALTLAADLVTEEAQDVILQPITEFYKRPCIPESTKDLGFAFGGMAIALFVNRRRSVD